MTSKRPTIGSLRHVVDVQEATRVRDAVNGLVPGWAAVDGGEGLRASVRAATAFERTAYAHDVGGLSHVVTMRHPGFVPTSAHRLVWGDRVLEIRGVVVDDLGRFVTIRCDETVTGGGGSDGE